MVIAATLVYLTGIDYNDARLILLLEVVEGRDGLFFILLSCVNQIDRLIIIVSRSSNDDFIQLLSQIVLFFLQIQFSW